MKIDHRTLKSKLETTWPNYKLEYANDHTLTSVHCKKLNTDPETKYTDEHLLNQHPLVYIEDVNELSEESMRKIQKCYVSDNGNSWTGRFCNKEEADKFLIICELLDSYPNEEFDQESPDETSEIEYCNHINIAKVRRSKKLLTDASKKKKLMKELENPNSMCIGPYVYENSKGEKYVKRQKNSRTTFYKRVSAKKSRNSKIHSNPREKNFNHKLFDYKWAVD